MSKPAFRLIIDAPMTGLENMEKDKAIYNGVSNGVFPPIIRIYEWTAPTLSLGYFQKESPVLNKERLSKMGVSLVRRMTGGRAVLHHKELTYSIAAPIALFPDGLSATYKIIAKCLLNGLKKSGFSAYSEPSRKNTLKDENRSCFASATSFEISINGKKLIGSAQKRNHSAFIQHGSILLDCDYGLYNSVFNHVSPEYPFTTLKQEEPFFDKNSLIQNIVSGFEEVLNIEFESMGKNGRAIA